ncbi:MAG: hypothetical protein HFG44_00405 [Oscillospiraceae bacterium]|nr:hypothetical protein [Oscillospiraceae bacterium]
MKKRFLICLLLCCMLFPLSACQKRQPEQSAPLKKDVTMLIKCAGFTVRNAEEQSLYFENGGLNGDMEASNWYVSEDYPDVSTLTVSLPYSNSFTYTAAEIDDIERSFTVATSYYGSVFGTGIGEITVDKDNQIRVTGKDMRLNLYADVLSTENIKLSIHGGSPERVTLTSTKTGAIAEGLTGTGTITSTLYPDAKTETTYSFTGEAVEIDVVSQPGEILITPVPNTFSS